MELDVADRGTRQARRKRRARGHVLHRGHRRRDAATHGSGRTLANPAIARTRPADRPVQCGYVLRQGRTPGSRHARHRVRCSVHRHRALQNIQRVAWARSRRRHLARHRLAYRGDRPQARRHSRLPGRRRFHAAAASRPDRRKTRGKRAEEGAVRFRGHHRVPARFRSVRHRQPGRVRSHRLRPCDDRHELRQRRLHQAHRLV